MVAFMQYLNRIQFGVGALATLSDEMAMLGVRRPLVMSDAGVAGAGILNKVLASLRPGLEATVRADCPRHPTEEAANDMLAAYRADKCDCIVAVGGGVVIDLAKSVALLCTHAGPLMQYTAEAGGMARIRPDMAPLIAVPTTAGTGTEISRGIAIRLTGDGPMGFIKGVIMSVNLIPKVAICDPNLTSSAPPAIVAGAGADALGHCLEAYLSPSINPPVDAIALDGIRRLAASLPRSIEEPTDPQARWDNMMGATEGAMSFWKGLGAAHAMATALDVFDAHHGVLVGLVMPHVVRAARRSAPDRLAVLDAIFGGPAEDRLQMLNERIGLPKGLGAVGVPRDALPAMAEESAESVFNRTACPKASVDDYLAMLNQAY